MSGAGAASGASRPGGSPWAGRRVAVSGVALSGEAAAEALLDEGARVLVVDARDGERERATAARLRALGAEVRLGDAESSVDADLVVTSPGWRPTQPLLAAALGQGVEVIGEPELAWRMRVPSAATGRPAPWAAVTGTNGKTTTVGMVESVLRAAGHRVVAAGNVGLPLVRAARDPSLDTVAVELSSFQLHWSRELAPEAAVVLNVAEDHLDWHGDLAAYAEAKARVWRAGGCGAYNADDPLVAGLARRQLDDPHPFTLGAPPAGGLGVVEGVLTDAMAGWSGHEARPALRDGGIALLRVDELAVTGAHNVANALAAAAVTRVLGLRGGVREVGWEAVRDGLRAYRPGAHRNTVVGERAGVAYVDDSKATNPHAAAASLAAYPTVVWVAGGLLKGADVDPLVRAHHDRLHGVVLVGTDRTALAAALARHAPDVPVVEVDAAETDVMRTAVDRAAALARPGDVVLLAPAAASMDQFRDYAERGDRFAAAVAELPA